jgi:putative restriction endonuclease
MKFWVGVTDNDWFDFLSRLPGVDEVNFWQPGGQRTFAALPLGAPFLFKLHSPLNYVVGGGFFAHATRYPLSLAWEAFQEKNGAPSLEEMRALIDRHRGAGDPLKDYEIGCILLTEPFFLRREEWIPAPPDFHRNIVQGKTYETESVTGRALWDRVMVCLAARDVPSPGVGPGLSESPVPRFGTPTLVRPRLGQGSFRMVVADTYHRKCAVTRERTLPALDAAHIRPYKKDGPHSINNGFLLRRDIHSLFDRGYVTISEDLHFEVGRRIREEFENGRDYYALHGREVIVPESPQHRPDPGFLRYHADHIFRG